MKRQLRLTGLPPKADREGFLASRRFRSPLCKGRKGVAPCDPSHALCAVGKPDRFDLHRAAQERLALPLLAIQPVALHPTI